VFRKQGQGANANVGVRRKPLYVRRPEEDGEEDAAAAGQGAIFVSDFPDGMSQEELLGALAPLGKYERFVMRTCLFFLPCSLSGFLGSADSYKAPVQNTGISCIRATIAPSMYCSFTDAFLSPCAGKPCAWNAQRAYRTAWTPIRQGISRSTGSRSTPRRLALSSRSSRRRCRDGEARLSPRACSGSAGCPPTSLATSSRISGAVSAASSKSAQVRDTSAIAHTNDRLSFIFDH